MNNKQAIRTRLAASPTGIPHLGTAYIALFNMVFSLHSKGKFILRIEDTDKKRSTLESELQIIESLKWLGIKWHEGPDISGNYGPYRQSERVKLGIYKKYIKILLDNNKAYKCVATVEELEKYRNWLISKKQKALYKKNLFEEYRLKYLTYLDDIEINNRLQNGNYVIRLFTPNEGICICNDVLRGVIKIAWQEVDDQVLIKEDGYPTYHFANVVDDYLMKINYVIRGEEWINSLPKHILLYDSFKWEKPNFCHLSLIRNLDKSKLSKRKNPVSISYYKDFGILPEALLNYLGLISFSFKDNQEIFSIDEFIKNIDIKRIHLSAPVFDINKLLWLNAKWIRNLSTEDFLARLKLWFLKDQREKLLLDEIQKRITNFSEVIPLLSDIFNTNSDVDYSKYNYNQENVKEILDLIKNTLENNYNNWNFTNLLNALKLSFKEKNINMKDAMKILYLSLTNKESSLPIFKIMEFLGPDVTIVKINNILKKI